jgi:DNA-binding NarL/FixJ family response regulator
MKVLLVQSDNIARSDFPALVQGLLEDVEVLQTNDAVRMIARLSASDDPQLLIAEYHLARAFWFVSTLEATRRVPSTRLVVWTSTPSYSELLCASQLDAMAYLPATAPPSVTRAALQVVMAGGRYFPPELLAQPQVEDRDLWRKARPSLTPRQAEVLTLMAAGKSNKEIARELGTSTGTVKVHVTAILKALKVRNRTEAAISGPADVGMFARPPSYASHLRR